MPRTRANDTQISTLGDLAEGPAWTEGEQLRIAFENLTQALAASVFCAFVIVALLWPVANAPALILWLGSLSTLTLLRLMMQQQYQRSDRDAEIFMNWKRGYTGATFMAGVVWGCLAVFAFPADSILHQAYLAIVLSGISAGAVSAYAPIPRAFPFFIIPTLAPFAIQMITHNETHGMIMALLVMAFMLALMRIARDSRNNVEIGRAHV